MPRDTEDRDQDREELKPTCEGMATGMPGPIDDQDDQNGGDTSPSTDRAQ